MLRQPQHSSAQQAQQQPLVVCSAAVGSAAVSVEDGMQRQHQRSSMGGCFLQRRHAGRHACVCWHACCLHDTPRWRAHTNTTSRQRRKCSAAGDLTPAALLGYSGSGGSACANGMQRGLAGGARACCSGAALLAAHPMCAAAWCQQQPTCQPQPCWSSQSAAAVVSAPASSAAVDGGRLLQLEAAAAAADASCRVSAAAAEAACRCSRSPASAGGRRWQLAAHQYSVRAPAQRAPQRGTQGQVDVLAAPAATRSNRAYSDDSGGGRGRGSSRSRSRSRSRSISRCARLVCWRRGGMCAAVGHCIWLSSRFSAQRCCGVHAWVWCGCDACKRRARIQGVAAACHPLPRAAAAAVLQGPWLLWRPLALAVKVPVAPRKSQPQPQLVTRADRKSVV